MLSLVQTWITVLGIFPVFEISRHASVEPNRKVSEQYREYIKRALAISYMLQLYVNIYFVLYFRSVQPQNGTLDIRHYICK